MANDPTDTPTDTSDTTAGLGENYINWLKQKEAFSPKAYWDHRQYSIGYGTKANSANEQIDRAEADSRLRSEVAKAADAVDALNPNLDRGTRTALTDYAYNAGPGALGDLHSAITTGNTDAIKAVLPRLRATAGGIPNTGLATRRAETAAWVGSNGPASPVLNPNGPPQGTPAMADDNSVDGQRSLWQKVLGGSGGMTPALQDAGAYLMGINSPAALGATEHTAKYQALQRPQVVDGGTDPFTGQKRLLTFNPHTGTFTPATFSIGPNGSVTSGAGGMSGGSMDGFRAAMNKGVGGEDLLNYVPPEVKGYLQALKEGRAIPGNMGRSGPQRAALLNVAHEIWPEMDETNIQARQTMAKSMANPSPNQLGGQITSANTLMNHTSLLQQDIDNLEKLQATGKYPIQNMIKQFAAGNIPGAVDEKVQAALSSFNKHKQAVASELTRLTRGSNGSMQEVQDWKNGLNSADSIASLRSGTAAVVDLMHGRLQAGVDGYNRAMNTNKTIEEYLSPQAKAAIDRISGDTAQYEPNATQSAPAAAPTAAHTIVNPKTGARMILKDGQWQPIK